MLHSYFPFLNVREIKSLRHFDKRKKYFQKIVIHIKAWDKFLNIKKNAGQLCRNSSHFSLGFTNLKWKIQKSESVDVLIKLI